MEARAKPLNALTRSALQTGVVAWDNEIKYLEDALVYCFGDKLRESLAKKLADLKRSRDWLSAKLASVEE